MSLSEIKELLHNGLRQPNSEIRAPNGRKAIKRLISEFFGRPRDLRIGTREDRKGEKR